MSWIIEFWEIISASPALSTGAGAIILLILARIVPNAKLDVLGEKFGVFLSAVGTKVLPFWNKFEKLLINGLAVFTTAVIRGLRKDNADTTKKSADNK